MRLQGCNETPYLHEYTKRNGQSHPEKDVAPWMVYGFYEQGGGNGNTGFIISVNGGQEKRVGNGEPRIKLNEWNHLAAVYDGKEQRFYLNGEVKAKGAASGKIDTNDIPVSIGRNNVGNREHFVGVIDESLPVLLLTTISTVLLIYYGQNLKPYPQVHIRV